MKDKSYVYFWVAGFGQDASDITQMMGMQPTRIQIIGQPRPDHPKQRRQTFYRESSWEIHSPLSLFTHVDEHLDALIQLLEPHSDGIEAVVQKFQAGINCAIYYYEDFTPGIHLSENIVKQVALWGLSVDLDLYFLGKKNA